MKKIRCFLLIAVFSFIMVGSIFAESLVVSEKHIPDLDTLVDSLALKPDEFRRKTGTIRVHFDINSATIKPESAKVLDIIGKAMQTERLLTFHFDLEGHTDASGEKKYNLNLSERRALSVKNYLVAHCGVAEDRFSWSGRGESDPVDPDPFAAENRRVELYTVR
ncbi:MAG: OmpA family protein [Deltaproteobacteria bacterium]|nr:OmpA family protein [Candidatus Tharpella sp.]